MTIANEALYMCLYLQNGNITVHDKKKSLQNIHHKAEQLSDTSSQMLKTKIFSAKYPLTGLTGSF